MTTWRSVPRMIFSIESVKSLCSTCSWSRRAAKSAALLTSSARSAPVMPGVEAAICSRSTPSSSGTERVWISRIFTRPGRSGGCTAMRRSKRPGRSSAGSSTSGRFVAPRTMTLSCGEKPSISVRIWLSVCSRSSLPPLRPPTLPDRERPIASSSSTKMIAGAASLACLKRSRTREAPTPTIASTNSDAEAEKNAASASPATARASSVFPRARRAVEQHAARDARTEAHVLLRVLEEVDDLDQLALGLVDPGHVVERDAVGLTGRHAPRGRAPEAAQDAPGAAARLPAHEPDEQADEQDRRAEAEEQRREERAAAVDRLGVDDDALGLELLGQVRRVDERRDLGLEEVDAGRLLLARRREVGLLLEVALDRLALRGDLLDVAGLDLLEKERRVGDLRALRRAVEDERRDEVQDEQRDDQRDPAAAAREHRRLGLRRRAAAVGRGLDAPTLAFVGRRRALWLGCGGGGGRDVGSGGEVAGGDRATYHVRA